ncbi:MAG: replication initiator protein [Microviridae sp.]|nr:MAG: replication initiator protein [Microviridae sp.]
MSCVYPLEGWRSAKLNDNGKRPITFKVQEAFQDMPLQVPCGKCVGCARDRSMAWTVRNYHEWTQHRQSCFLTLTYQDPAPDKINKRDLQLFFKRLRESIDVPVRYFAVGEYGETTHRPHYHALLYGADLKGKSYALDDKQYGSTFIDRTWHHGSHAIGDVNYASIAYVSGYVLKKAGNEDTFNLMSKRPPIGHGWTEKYIEELERTGHVVIDGHKLPIPRKYIELYPGELQQQLTRRKRFYTTMKPDQVEHHRKARPHREANYQSAFDRRIEKL